MIRPCFAVLLLLGCASAQEAPRKEESPKWPRSYEESGDRVVVYDPQVDGGWKDYKSLRVRSAIVVTPKGGAQDWYGVLEYDVDTEVNSETRDVLFKNRKIRDIRFRGVPEASAKQASEIVRRVLPEGQSILVP